MISEIIKLLLDNFMIIGYSMKQLHHKKLDNGINLYHLTDFGNLIQLSIHLDYAFPLAGADAPLLYFIKQYLTKTADTPLDIVAPISYTDRTIMVSLSEEEVNQIKKKINHIFNADISKKDLEEIKKLAIMDINFRSKFTASWPFNQNEYIITKEQQKTFEKETIENLLKKTKEILVGNNLNIICSGGDLSEIIKVLSNIDTGEKFRKPIFKPIDMPLNERVIFDDHTQTTMTEINLSFYSFNLSDKEQAAQYMTGVLHDLYNKRKLKNSPYIFVDSTVRSENSMTVFGHNYHIVSISTIVNMDLAKKKLSQFYKSVTNIKYTEEEFELAKKYALYKLDYLLTNHSTRHAIVLAMRRNDSVDIEYCRGLIKKVNDDDVKQFIKKYINLDHLSLTISGAIPFRNTAEVIKMINV